MSFFCEVDLIYSGGGEKNLAVFFSCEIYQCTYLYNILRLFIQITFLLQKSLPFIQGHVKDNTYMEKVVVPKLYLFSVFDSK